MLIVIPSFVGLLILADPICKALFKDNIEMLVNVLRVGSIAVVFFSLSTVTIGILQGLGLYNKPLKNALIALVVHIIVCIVLLVVFNLNIYAIVFGMIVFALVLGILNQRDINKVVRYRNSSFEKRYILTFVLMTFSAVVMGAAVFFLNRFLENVIFIHESIISIWIRLIICIIVALSVYTIFIVILGVVRKRDAAYIPFISKFDRFLWS